MDALGWIYVNGKKTGEEQVLSSVNCSQQFAYPWDTLEHVDILGTPILPIDFKFNMQYLETFPASLCSTRDQSTWRSIEDDCNRMVLNEITKSL